MCTATLTPFEGAIIHNYCFTRTNAIYRDECCFLPPHTSLHKHTLLQAQIRHTICRHMYTLHFRKHLCVVTQSFSGGYLLLPTHEHTSARHPPGEPQRPQSSPVSTFYSTGNRLRRLWRENRSPAPRASPTSPDCKTLHKSLPNLGLSFLLLKRGAWIVF